MSAPEGKPGPWTARTWASAIGGGLVGGTLGSWLAYLLGWA